MSSIIAGRFQTFEQAESAVQALTNADIRREDISVFYVTPAGQHDEIATTDDSAGPDLDAMESENDVVAGAAAGGAIGLAVGIAAAVPLVGAAAVAVTAMGVGAYTGSFAGNLAGSGDRDIPPPTPRRAGVLVAVRVEENHVPERASIILSAQGGEDLEMADGVLRDGKWIDFDPVTPQRFISAPVDLR
jgi:hypothetical protein